jgi:hypothetical protein
MQKKHLISSVEREIERAGHWQIDNDNCHSNKTKRTKSKCLESNKFELTSLAIKKKTYEEWLSWKQYSWILLV